MFNHFLKRRRFASVLICIFLIGGTLWLVVSGRFSTYTYASRSEDKAPQLELKVTHHFNQRLEEYGDLSYEQLLGRIRPRDYLETLPFDPLDAKHFTAIEKRLQLTPQEVELYQTNGFVSCDLMRRYGFAGAYYEIYVRDLPVLITTDSILHAMHRSFDTILMQLELELFIPKISKVLESSHAELGDEYGGQGGVFRDSAEDVDLYLTVARSLLKGSPVDSYFVDQERCQKLLEKIAAEKMEVPFQDSPTPIYGGSRHIDYSQFKPRGHYASDERLGRYFRCMMWLGRADTGWYVSPPNPASMIVSDTPREQRNSILLAELLEHSGALESLLQVNSILSLFVGRSDNLRPTDLLRICQQVSTPDWCELMEPDLDQLADAIVASGSAEQMIRSQAIVSPISSSKVPPPCSFQLFGQRFVVDSFVLSQVVFDSIVYQGAKPQRMMPSGLDVMAALGNNEAIPLLKNELEQFNYSANMLAAQEIVESFDASFWEANLYHTWLNGLRMLDEDHRNTANFPSVMNTKLWQRKQLQTQLASWAELRHDTILYAKQSYSALLGCEYPDAYVEPYPEFFGNVKNFAEQASTFLSRVKAKGESRKLLQGHVKYFHRMAEVMQNLETISRKQLAAKKLTKKETQFLERVVDQRGSLPNGSGPGKIRFDGWYCELLFEMQDDSDWAPIIADVHTNPQSRECLEVGTGDANLMVIAIDNEDDLGAYAGPVFTYYEFRHPAERRLTDESWHSMLIRGEAPKRPDWVSDFQAPAAERQD